MEFAVMFNSALVPERGKMKQRLYLLFWLTFLLSLSFEISSFYLRFGWWHYIIVLTGRMVCIAAVVYANIYYFIPKVLRKGRYILFALSLLATAVFLYFGTAFFNYFINITDGSIPVFSFSKAYLLTLIFTGFRISFLAYLLFLAMEWIDQKFSIQELELQKKEVENKYLRNQLNPHFLFNTMNNLHGLILTDTKLASDSVLRFSDFLQYMVYESAEEFIPLEKEIELVKDYLALERLRADKKKEINLDIHITDMNYKIAPLLLLPLVENGIKHGLNIVEDGAFLKVQVEQQQQFLTVCVTNKKAVNAQKSEGIGIENLKRRLELQYKDSHEMHFHEDADVFKAQLKLKLHAL